MRLKEIGEKELILKLLKLMENIYGGLLRYDDVEAIEIYRNILLVLKTDTFVKSSDFLPGMSAEDAGRKFVVMNVSDFAAKGVKPMGMLLSLVSPKEVEVDFILKVYKGIYESCKEYGIKFLGGDTSQGNDLVLSGFLYGLCEKDKLVKRSGAKVGDILATTGKFGKTSVAYQILLRGLDAPDDKVLRNCINAVFRPKARLKEGLTLAERKLVTASIDSSDGLAISLHELSDSSSVGFLIEEIPIAEEAISFAEYHGINLLDLVLYLGGEEYELIVTIPEEKWDEARKLIRSIGGELYYLGRVVPKREGIYLRRGSQKILIERKGWSHFKEWL